LNGLLIVVSAQEKRWLQALEKSRGTPRQGGNPIVAVVLFGSTVIA
jgi:hypothetical protein